MAEKKQTPTTEKTSSTGCKDVKCPFHGQLKIRGRLFRGTVISKHAKRVCIEFDRTVFIRKYERFAKKRTRLHAWLPECLSGSINIGDYIEIGNCRQLSKIISFVVVKKIRDKSEKKEELK
jgi:small subunit ribosomal protein S17